jgi:acyl transferase domain-containing protein
MDGDAGQVAIVGMAVLLPGADSLDAYWNNLVSGYDAITDPPPGRWQPEFYDPQSAQPDRVYCRRGGFLETVEFDPLQFGVVPSAIRDTEPEQLIALQVAAAAVADAGGAARLPDPERVGVIVGRNGSGSVAQGRFFGRVRLGGLVRDILQQVLPDIDDERLDLVSSRIRESFGPFHRESVIGLTPNLTASRLANRLGLGGQAYTVDAACASSLIAVSNALAELQSHRLDAVLVGGVHHMQDVAFWSMFSQLGALSRRGEIRPFDRAADGLLIGEATGMVLLKRLPDALRQGDRIYAVIRGAGTSSDGRSASLFNPDTSGQVLAIRRAWAAAGLDPAAPDALGMLEAHGTATPTGDAAELATVAEVFGRGHGGTQPIIGSVKSMIGHTMAAAGIVSLIKSALAVSKGMLLPTLHCDDPQQSLEETRFAPIASARPWTGPGPRRAAVNAFGFGGINAHVILEEPPGVPPSSRGSAGSHPGGHLVHEPDQVILLAAPSPEAVSRLLDAGDEVLRDRSRQSALDTVIGPGPGCRLGIVDPTAQRIATARDLVARGEAWRGGASIWFSPQPLLTEGGGQVAFVFPGLEADFRPQLTDVTEHLGLAADDPAAQGLGGPAVDVLRTGLLMHDAVRRLGIAADAVAGYSLGEWTAWAVAGIAERTDFYRLAAVDWATTEVSVVVVATGCPGIEMRLADYPGVALSIDSAPNQSVVCGPADEVGRLATDLRREGILSQPLPFSAGYHTEYYRGAARALTTAADFEPRRGRIPVWSSVISDLLPDDPAQQRDLFFRHLVEPVRFRDTIRAMHQAGIRAFIQVGVGQLASVMHENLRGLEHLTVAANVSQRSGLSQLQRLATALWVEGLAPDLRALGIVGPAAAKSSAPRRSHPVQLQLSWAGISLGSDAGSLLGPSVSTGAGSSRMAVALSQLRTANVRGARELTAVLEDTAVSVASVLAADIPPALDPASAAAAAAPAGPGTRDGGEATAQRIVQRVSLDSMPYLKDHCFFAQPENWPHMSDRWPVLPGTAITQHLIDAVESVVAGAKVVKVTGVRLNRWVLAEPAQDIEITIEPAGANKFRVRYGPYASALAHTAEAYPTPQSPWRRDPAAEQTPEVTVEWLYENISFLGDGYQGIADVPRYGRRHVSAEIRAPAAPGALLDSGLQLVGFWLYSTQAYRKLGLPVAFKSISFAGPTPPIGSLLTVTARVGFIDDDEIRCEIQYSCGDKVWAQLEGGMLKRFASEAVLAQPARHFFAERQPGGWVVAVDGWTDAITPVLIANQALGASGYARYERRPLRGRRQWLLSQLAVKDAVRLQLRRNGVEDVFPIEITVADGQDGQPRVRGWAQRPLPSYHVSVASAGKMAVAMARAASADEHEDGPGVGISIISMDLFMNGTRQSVLSAGERTILESVTKDSREQENVWLTRFMASKKAAAKAAGAAGDEDACTITGAESGQISIYAAGHHYQIGYRELHDPGEIPPGEYVVAWTWGPGRAPDYQGNEEHHGSVGHER